jgi:dCMP deaminase
MMLELTDLQINDFIKKAAFIACNSTCGYKVGCCGVINAPDFFDKSALKNPNIKIKNGLLYIKTWNETLAGEKYCQGKDENDCKICVRVKENLKGKEFEKVCSIHAEQNLIATCAKFQIPTNGMHLFLTNSPCYICAKSIIKSGISNVYYLAEHTDTSGLDILKTNNILFKKISLFL